MLISTLRSYYEKLPWWETKNYDNKLIGYRDHKGLSYHSYIPTVTVMTVTFQIKRWQDVGLKRFKDSNAFIESMNDINEVSKSTDEYNSEKRRKVQIVFDDMIAAMISSHW